MAKVPVQEVSPISDTTPISKSIIYGEYVVHSDCKKAAPPIEGHSPLSEPTKSKVVMDEEVQFVIIIIKFIIILSESKPTANESRVATTLLAPMCPTLVSCVICVCCWGWFEMGFTGLTAC
jgi:hypothetical protein